MTQKKRTKDMVYIALGAVIISICAWLTIPFVIPFTMQTFGVFAVFFLFGGKRGTLSVLVYLALGALGLPVFSGFNAGFGALLGVTGGFLWGFLAAGGVYLALECIFARKRDLPLAFAFIAQIVCYALGTGWYIFCCTDTTSAIGISAAISVCVLPYVIPDILKILLAYFLSKRISNILY